LAGDSAEAEDSREGEVRSGAAVLPEAGDLVQRLLLKPDFAKNLSI